MDITILVPFKKKKLVFGRLKCGWLSRPYWNGSKGWYMIYVILFPHYSFFFFFFHEENL